MKRLTTFAEAARRKNEIQEYGRLLSLRPSKVHHSKKQYKRVKVKYYEED